jgi:hypothetical protein
MVESDPCAEAARLRELRTAIVTGRSESQIRFGDEEVRYTAADLAALDRLIAETERACAVSLGRPLPRRRYARGIRF